MKMIITTKLNNKINFQSQAILRYLGAKYGLRAETLADQAREAMVEEEIVDLRNRFVHSAYYKEYNTDAELEAEKVELQKVLAFYLTELEKFLGSKDQKWITGDRLSYVDFIAYEYLDWYRDFVQPDAFAAFPHMAAYMARFEALPQLKDFLASNAYRKAPILNPTRTKFGYYR